jgi:hypothetical protein
MFGTRRSRLAGLSLGLIALVVAATGTLAVTTTLSAKGNMAVRIAREDTTTGSVTATTTSYVDIPGASLSINAPSTANGSVLMARFQGHFSLIQASACSVRIIVNDTTVMEPNGNYAIVGQYNVAESVGMSGEIERSLKVNQGTYTVKAQVRLSQVANANSKCIVGAWHFILERMNV